MFPLAEISLHSSYPWLAHMKGKSDESFEWPTWKKNTFSLRTPAASKHTSRI